MTYRLLKVIATAVLVSEDGDGHLIETLAEPVSVSSADWCEYPSRLLSQIAALTNGKETRMSETPTEPAPEPVEPDEPGEPSADTEGMGPAEAGELEESLPPPSEDG